jgi:NAD(P)-dependent dehydrogenase (short-subunit alcohol dehydrogenase family)
MLVGRAAYPSPAAWDGQVKSAQFRVKATKPRSGEAENNGIGWRFATQHGNWISRTKHRSDAGTALAKDIEDGFASPPKSIGEMRMNNRLKGKAIVVVGAGTGIGAAVVRRVAAEGARVCVADINLGAAQAVAADVVKSGGEAFAVHIDVAEETSVQAAIAAAIGWLGRLDGAHINPADMSVLAHDSTILDQDLAVFDRTIQVNLRGHVLCTRAVLPHLIHAGGGAIVYTSSGACEAGEPVRPAYAIAKTGLNALMRHVASGWGKQGITANSIAPGVVLTAEMRARNSELSELQQLMLATTPSRRLGQSEDIAAAVALLLSDDGNWINGQVLHVNGGKILH